MTPPKRPRDPNQLAKSIIDIATGQKPDRDQERIEPSNAKKSQVGKSEKKRSGHNRSSVERSR
jgi:hypothetical protein